MVSVKAFSIHILFFNLCDNIPLFLLYENGAILTKFNLCDNIPLFLPYENGAILTKFLYAKLIFDTLLLLMYRLHVLYIQCMFVVKSLKL